MSNTRTTITNRDEAYDMLTAAQKRSRIRTFDSVEEVAGRLAEIVGQTWIFDALRIDQLAGIEVTIDAAQGEHFPSSYKGTPQSTHVTLRFTRDGWRVVKVERAYVQTRTTTLWAALRLTRDQLDLAAARWASGAGIVVTEVAQ